MIWERGSNNKSVYYVYDTEGNVTKVSDSSGNTIRYQYDVAGRLSKYTESGQGRNHSVSYIYNNYGNLLATVEGIGQKSYTTTYEYDARNRINRTETGIAADDSVAIVYRYDDLGRVTTQYHQAIEGQGEDRVGLSILTKTLTYQDREDMDLQTSERIAGYEVYAPVSGTEVAYSYEYDDNGNITRIQAGLGVAVEIARSGHIWSTLVWLAIGDEGDGVVKGFGLCVYTTDHQVVSNFSSSFTCRSTDFVYYKDLVDS